MSEQGTVHKPTPKNTTIPVKLLHDPNAKDGTIRLYAHMFWRYGSNKKNFEGQRSMSSYLKITRQTISKRIKELEFLDWLVVVERDFNATTGNYTTPHYHLFLSQSDCRKFRAEYQAIDGERMRPKPSEDEIELRKSRAGKGREGGNPDLYRVNSGLPGDVNSGLHGRVNSGLPKRLPVYPSEDANASVNDSTSPSGDVVSPDAAMPSKGKPSSLIVDDPEILIDDRVPTPKKERPPCKWEPLHDALLEAFGLEKAQMTPKADKIYWTVAHELYVVKMTPDQIPDFYTFMANKAKANDWSDWTVSAMAKYAPDFLRDGHKKAVPEFARGIHWVGGE
jgi:hypothetical protein